MPASPPHDDHGWPARGRPGEGGVEKLDLGGAGYEHRAGVDRDHHTDDTSPCKPALTMGAPTIPRR